MYKRVDKQFNEKLAEKGQPRIKLERKIVGLIAEAMMPCGCHAQVSIGAARNVTGVSRMSYHVCADWKQHKYELANAERDLAVRLRKFRRVL